jgi:hypothetical protein
LLKRVGLLRGEWLCGLGRESGGVMGVWGGVGWGLGNGIKLVKLVGWLGVGGCGKGVLVGERGRGVKGCGWLLLEV